MSEKNSPKNKYDKNCVVEDFRSLGIRNFGENFYHIVMLNFSIKILQKKWKYKGSFLVNSQFSSSDLLCFFNNKMKENYSLLEDTFFGKILQASKLNFREDFLEL